MREHPSFRTTLLEFFAFPFPHKWSPDQVCLKGNQAEDASWPVNVQNMQICPSMGFICFFCQHFYKRSTFFLNCKSELPRAQPCWFALHQWGAEKGWLTTYSIHLPHMPNLYIAFVLEHFLAPCFIGLFMFFVKCIECFIWMTSHKANLSTQRQ